MWKAARLLAVLALLLAADAWAPRTAWMPAPLMTRALFQADWWPFARPAVSEEATAESGDDEGDFTLAAVATTDPFKRAEIASAAAREPVAGGSPRAHRKVDAASDGKAFVAPVIAGWDDFRKQLDELESGKRTKVRVVQLGDSEIAGDWVTKTLRRQFGQKYGEGGPGFALAMAPWPWYWREGYRHSEPDGFSVHSFVFGKASDGNYGPGGIGFDSNHKGASATVKLEDPPDGGCEISFHFGTAPDGGEVEIFADGTKLDHISTIGTDRGPAVKRYPLGECPELLTATVTTDAKARIFGWTVEATRAGIVWSSLGVVSATDAHLQHYGVEQLVRALDTLRPDLIVVGYGLNLVHSGQPPPSGERATFKTVLADLRAGVKGARCLVVSPYPVVISQDGELTPSTAVSVLARYQREAAGEAGCAFLDRELLAGGPGTGLKWLEARPRILSGDYIHLTQTGSEHIGRQMAQVLLNVKPETL